MTRHVIASMAFALVVMSAAADEKVEPSPAKIKSLQKERLEALKKAMATRERLYQAGRVEVESLLELSEKLLKAELELATGKEQRLSAHTDHRDRTKSVAAIAKARFEAARGTESDYQVARAAYLEAEIAWLKAGGVEKKEKKDK